MREIIPNNTRIIRNNTSYPSEQYKSNRPAVVPDSRASPLCHALHSKLFLPLRNLPLDPLDHLCQLFLAFLSRLCIDVPLDPLAAGAGFAVFGFVGFEATLVDVGLHLPSIPDAVQE